MMKMRICWISYLYINTFSLCNMDEQRASVKVYTYDIASVGLQPSGESFCSTDCLSILSPLSCYCGFGRPIGTIGEYGVTSGDYKMLPVIFYHRIKSSAYYTSNPYSANLFFIPIFFFSDTKNRWFKRFYNTTRHNVAMWSWSKSRFWMFMLSNADLKMEGKDHFVVVGEPLGCDAYTEFAFISSEEMLWLKGNYSLSDHDVQKITRLQANIRVLTIEGEGPLCHTIPYPSHLHFGLQAGFKHWNTSFMLINRTTLVSYVGNKRYRDFKDTAIMKNHIYNDCALRDQCVRVNARPFSSLKKKGPELKLLFVDTYLHSVFCLQPGGETYTRKGFWDSIVVGCIPVVFHIEASHYPWHLTPVEDYTVFINGTMLLSGQVKYIDFLLSIPYGEIRRKQGNIERIRQTLQYNWISISNRDGHDAVDVSLIRLWAQLQNLGMST